MKRFKKFELKNQSSIYGGMFTVHNTCWEDNQGVERSDTYDDETGEVTYD